MPMRAGQDTRFSCARYGNVVGSRGSVIPIFLEQRKRGRITLTDPRMTRFWLTLEPRRAFCDSGHRTDAWRRNLRAQDSQHATSGPGQADRSGVRVEYIGIRSGEKLHEVLLSEDEARNAVELDEMYIIQPSHPWWKSAELDSRQGTATGLPLHQR